MFKPLVAALCLAALAGCQSTKGNLWNQLSSKDAFTDQVTKMVTVGSVGNDRFLMTQSFHLYPFVGTQNGELFVGVRSGGSVRIPTGTVQMRIDDKTAWTIAPEETPLSLVPSTPSIPASAFAAGNEEMRQAVAQMTDNIMKQASPYTAATGAKAKAIVKEMMAGKVVKFRSVGINQGASTTGEVQIDESFVKSLREIGVTPETL